MTVTRETYIAGRVLNALLREDYGGMASLLTRDKDGALLVLASGRKVRLSPGGPFQDFVLASSEALSLHEVLETLETVADRADAPGVAAFATECHETLAALELYDLHRDESLIRLLRREPDQVKSLIFYETLAAAVDHPIYPTARCRLGVCAADMLAHAPEFAPGFDLRWAAVWRDGVMLSASREPAWWPRPGDVGLPDRMTGTHALFPVHPLTVPAVEGIPGVIVGPASRLTVRPTLSMRTVEVDRRTHLKLPLATSTLGLRNRRSIKPATLRDGALAESLLREVLRREPDLRVSLAGEQSYGHGAHEYLGWMIRDLPEGEIVSVAALLAPFPGTDQGRSVLDQLAGRFYGGHDRRGGVRELLRDYLTTLFTWNTRLFVRYGIALEAHQQNLSLVFGDDGPPRLLVKDNDGLLVSPDRLQAAGLDVPDFADERMLADDPHALADVFVTITLHLAAAAVIFGAHLSGAADLLRETLAEALDEFGDHPMARLLRARTLDAARLVGKSMVTAATLVDKQRSGARDINKFYGASGPNYLRPSGLHSGGVL